MWLSGCPGACLGACLGSCLGAFPFRSLRPMPCLDAVAPEFVVPLDIAVLGLLRVTWTIVPCIFDVFPPVDAFSRPICVASLRVLLVVAVVVSASL